MQKLVTGAAFAAIIGLAACGDTPTEQAVIGAAAGAGTALVLDGNVAGGALVGAGGNLLYCDQNPGAC